MQAGKKRSRRSAVLYGPRLMLVGYFAVLAAVVAVVLPSLLSTVHLVDRQTQRYDPSAAAANALLVGALDQETGVRGYVITSRPSFLEPFNTGNAEVAQALAELRQLPLAKPVRVYVDRTADAIDQWREQFALRVIDDVRSGDHAAANTRIRSGLGRSYFDAFREEETRLRDAVSADVTHARKQLRRSVELSIAGLFVAVTAGVLLGLGLWLWWRNSGRRDAERDRMLADTAILLDALINATTNPIFAKDLEGRHILANRARAASLAMGDPDTEMIGLSVDDFVDPDAATIVRHNDASVIESRADLVVEETLPQPDGPHVFLTTKSPLYDSDGTVIGIVGVARDVTEERALRLDRERLYRIEHELATTLQEAMLGRAELDDARFAVCARYQPALDQMTVGGDWYDIVPLPDGRVGIITGDAVGRGIDAATAMGQLRSALSGLACSGIDPARALESLDRFAETVTGGESATCAFAIIDPANEQLTFSCAGHMPPLVLHADGRAVFLDQQQDPPLATHSARPRRLGTYEFPVGTSLILYTDGLVERRSTPIDVGLARLAAVAASHRDLPVGEMCDRVIGELLGDERRTDDIALVAARLLASDRELVSQA